MRIPLRAVAPFCLLLLACGEATAPVVDDAFLVGAADTPTTSGVVTRSTVLAAYVLQDVDAGLAALINFDRDLYCQQLEHRAPHEQTRIDHEDGQTTVVRNLENGLLVVFDGNPRATEILDCNAVLPPILGTGRTDLHQTRHVDDESPDGPARVAGSYVTAMGWIETADGIRRVRAHRQFTFIDPDGDDVLERHGPSRITIEDGA